MKTLVTGGLGFLGSYLVELLANNGDDVDVVDDMSSNAIDEIPRVRNVTLYAMPVEEFVRRQSVGTYDEIYHLASVVGPVGVLPHRGLIAKTIIGNTMLMIELARRSGARLCDVSTSEVYGGQDRGRLKEDDVTVFGAKRSARQEYAVGKLAAEVAITNSGVPAAIVRPFNVAGPRQRAKGGFVLPRFVRQALSNEPITVYGDGSARRAFTHAADVADGLVRATRRGAGSGDQCPVYNLGNEENETTILALAERVLSVTGSSVRISRVDPKLLHGLDFEEAPDKVPYSTRARAQLGWIPTRSLNQIVEETVAYERKQAA